jgi:hypothetical protein
MSQTENVVKSILSQDFRSITQLKASGQHTGNAKGDSEPPLGPKHAEAYILRMLFERRRATACPPVKRRYYERILQEIIRKEIILGRSQVKI